MKPLYNNTASQCLSSGWNIPCADSGETCNSGSGVCENLASVGELCSVNSDCGSNACRRALDGNRYCVSSTSGRGIRAVKHDPGWAWASGWSAEPANVRVQVDGAYANDDYIIMNTGGTSQLSAVFWTDADGEYDPGSYDMTTVRPDEYTPGTGSATRSIPGTTSATPGSEMPSKR